MYINTNTYNGWHQSVSGRATDVIFIWYKQDFAINREMISLFLENANSFLSYLFPVVAINMHQREWLLSFRDFYIFKKSCSLLLFDFRLFLLKTDCCKGAYVYNSGNYGTLTGKFFEGNLQSHGSLARKYRSRILNILDLQTRIFLHKYKNFLNVWIRNVQILLFLVQQMFFKIWLRWDAVLYWIYLTYLMK